MPGAVFKENKKRLFLMIFGIGFLALGLWLVQAPKAEANAYLGCAVNTYGDGSCAWEDTDSSLVSCETTQWCMINPFVPASFGGYTFPDSCSSTNRYCQKNACYNTDTQNSAACTVVKGKGGTGSCDTNTKTSGKWEASTKSCIQCTGAEKVYKIGDTSSLTYVDITDVFSTACGADTACQGKNSGNSCTVGVACESRANTCTASDTCNSNGRCEATAASCSGSVSLSLNPSTVSPSGSVSPSASGLTSCNSKTVSFREGSCAGTQKSSCTIPTAGTGCTGGSFTAPSSAGTYTYYACVDKNGDSDFSDSGEQGSASLTVSACPSGFSVGFGSGAYSKSDNFRISYGSSGNFCTLISRMTGGQRDFWAEDTLDNSSGSRTNFDTSVSGDSYVSAGTVVRATIKDSLTCDFSATCKVEITIVECTKNSDCVSNDCNLTTNTCNVAATPCSDSTKYVSGTVYVSGSPITTGSVMVSCPSCSFTDSIIAGDGGNYAAKRSTVIGEVCTVTANSSAPCGNSDSETFTVSASNPSIDFDLTACAATVCDNNGTCDAGETNANCPADCLPPPPPPPPPPCGSGGSSYTSPITYCKIQELIAGATGWILGLVSSIIILILIIGGIMYVTSAGDEERIRTAKNIILYATIGLAIILLAYSLITEVRQILKIS